MDTSEYLPNGETVLVSTQARQRDPATIEVSGTLACTEHRIVFLHPDEFLRPERANEITPEGITSIDYTGPSFLNRFTLAALPLLLVAIVGGVVASTVEPAAVALSLIFGIPGLIFLLVGLVRRTSTVKLRTTGQTYVFSGTDHEAMQKIPHAVRKAAD